MPLRPWGILCFCTMMLTIFTLKVTQKNRSFRNYSDVFRPCVVKGLHPYAVAWSGFFERVAIDF